MNWRTGMLRFSLVLFHDVIVAGASFLVALYLRWSSDMWRYADGYWREGVVVCAAIACALFIVTRLYRRMWRYVSLKDILTITKIAIVTIVVFYAAMFLTMRLELLPRSVPVLHLLVLLAMLCVPRFIYRALHERRLQLPQSQQIPVLLIGTGPDTELFIRESVRSPSFAYRVVGIISPDGSQIGQNIHHAKIYGGVADMEAVIRKLRRKHNAPQRVILTDGSLSGEQVREMLALADAEGATLGRMPRITDLTRSDGHALDVRPIDVEDILGRPQARLDREAMARIVAGKCVLVTGAGGSIGSELVRQIAQMNPQKLVLLDQGEYQLYAIDRELSVDYPALVKEAVLADVRDAKTVAHEWQRHHPQVVFHAAALKHVPLCELNPEEAVLTNVMGTQTVANVCVEYGVDLMVQISTDKAVNPSNVMGACKRLGEMVSQALGQSGVATRFVTVRFGNVLGSTGSVVPLFQQQLQRGGPLTVTHPDITRYFMTIREAVQLVIQAAALAVQDGFTQAAPVFVLDMGKPIRIADLAAQMIRLAGLRPEIDIKISYTGLRAGEKMHEELFYDSEPCEKTSHEAIMLAHARIIERAALETQLHALYTHAQAREREAMLAALRALVPEFVAA